jgi:hypothetical protein
VTRSPRRPHRRPGIIREQSGLLGLLDRHLVTLRLLLDEDGGAVKFKRHRNTNRNAEFSNDGPESKVDFLKAGIYNDESDGNAFTL